jgi:hypothetical protein
LFALRVEVNLTFLVEEGLAATLSPVGELIRSDDELWGPWRWHVEILLVFHWLSVFIGTFALFFFVVSLAGGDHDVLPLTDSVFVEVKVDFIDLTCVVEIYPEVLIVENSFDSVVRRIIAGILATSSRLNEKVLFNFPRASADEDPSMDSLAGVLIIWFVIRLVIVDCNCRLFCSLDFGFTFFLSLLVKF